MAGGETALQPTLRNADTWTENACTFSLAYTLANKSFPGGLWRDGTRSRHAL